MKGILTLMSELRLNGKTPDGAHLSLTDSSGSEYTVRISDTLRATVRCSAGPLGRGHDVIIAAIKIQGIRRVDLGKAEVACSEEQATSQKMSGRAMHSLHGLG